MRLKKNNINIRVVVICLIFFIPVGLCLGADNVAEFDKSWADPNTNFGSYEAVYIESIDVSGVEVDIWDPYPNDYGMRGDEKDKDDILYDVAFEAHRRFTARLEEVMLVCKDKDELRDKKAIIVDIKISGIIDSPGLLMKALGGSAAKYTLITLECEARDYTLGKKILSILDEESVDRESADGILSSPDTLGAWYIAFDLWAERLSVFLKN